MPKLMATQTDGTTYGATHTNSKNNAILEPIQFFIQLEMNSTTAHSAFVAMPQLSNVEANGVKLDYLEHVILKKL